jgi:hypothetical protein
MRLRPLALTALLLFGGMAGCTLWLARDPVPYFMARRDTTWRPEVTAPPAVDDHVTERVRLHAANGLRVDMQLRRPVDSTSAPVRRPVFLILGGYATGDRAAQLIPDTRGNIVVALAYPYDGNVRVKGLAVVPVVPALRRAILDTPPAVMLAIDYVLSRPDVDSNRVELVGASFGTPFGTVVGALDPRVTRVWSVHGAAWPYRQIELNLRRRMGTPVRQGVAALATLFASGWQLDPARWAPRIAPRPFIMINARDDERMPRDGVDALYAAAQSPKEQIWLDGPHVQGNRREVLAGLVDAVLLRSATP